MSDTRQDRILAAADELFGAHGFHAVSARDIARHAGVNKALVFYYFGSMDSLFEQVLERYYAAHRDALIGGLDPALPVREQLHTAIDRYVDFVDANRRYPLLVQRIVAGDPAHHDLIMRNQVLLYEGMREALKGLAPDAGPLAARHFFVTFSGAVINYFTYEPVLRGIWDRDPGSAEAVAERRAHLHWLVDTLLEGLDRAD